MKLTLLSLAIAALVATFGCSSPPKVVVPDGSARRPVNSEARIAEYRARTGEEQAASAERSALTRQVAYLQGEILKLKTYVIQLSTIASSSEAAPARALPPAPSAPPASQAAESIRSEERPKQPTAAMSTESSEVRDGAVVFRVMQPFGKAEFSPSAAFQGELLNRARESARIDVRGRTDARADNAGDRSIAQRRALCARAFLIDNGIPARKIHVSFLAAGDRLASNATPQGRAFNRRIEIETLGVNTRASEGSSNVVGRL
jgi:outer membrane protein OmpA-like peptidoglycan-associated protein